MSTSILSESWRSISTLGVAEQEEFGRQRTFVLNNQITASIILVLSALIILFRITVPGNHVIVIWLCGLLIALGLSLFLNGYGFFRFNQLLLGTGISLLLLGATIHSKLHHPDLIHEGSYYNPRFFLIGLCFIPFVVFELKNRLLWLSTALNLAMLFFYNSIHELFGAGPTEIMGEEIISYSFITVASSSASTAVVLSLYFLKVSNFKYEKQIKSLLKETQLKQDEIESSIRYARHLQESVITSGSGVLKISENTACLNLPKDIVSGDFFLKRRLADGSGVLVTADCTGHGVPGAFVSLMAFKTVINTLGQSHDTPGRALSLINRTLCSDFKRGEAKSPKDGMDMSMVRVDAEKKTLHYSNAKSFIYLINNEGVERLESERKSIGDNPGNFFESFDKKYSPGDILVMTTDGFTDQFGGARNKKFGRKRFETILQEYAGLGSFDIATRLHDLHLKWKLNFEQTDDVCVLVHELK